jgi:hypothetical protein
MISKDDEVMFRDAHDKLTLWLEKWDEFVGVECEWKWYEEIFEKYKKYHAHCSLCERFCKENIICFNCPLKIESKTCLKPGSLFNQAYEHQNKSALIEMIRIVDEAWEKARGE